VNFDVDKARSRPHQDGSSAEASRAFAFAFAATGIAMDNKAFDSSEMSKNRVGCTHSGEMHVWNKEQAYVKQIH
jgi:hypothetical protein